MSPVRNHPKPKTMNPVRDNRAQDDTKPYLTGAQARPVSNGMNNRINNAKRSFQSKSITHGCPRTTCF